jgi:two-component system, OmpR family, sensor histidine kinase BaeS
MRFGTRITLVVIATALFSVSVTGYLSFQAAGARLPRVLAADAPQRGVGTAMGPRSHLLMLQELRGANLQAAAIALAVAAVVGSLLAYRLTRPVAEMAQVTQRYGHGERGLRAQVSGNDELSELARVFNRTADQLQAEQDAKQRFLTDVAHELRTPLTVLKSELEAVQDGLMQVSSDTAPQLLQQVDLLTRLVQDLRLLTLAEGGELALQRAPVSLDELVRATAAGFASRAAAQEVRLEVDAQPVRAVVDRERLQQVLMNLLDNALRHAPRGTRVRVSLAATEDAARFDVRDQGPGIPADRLSEVFERFYRLDGARGRDAGGSGLGLAIAKAIVELHGGSVAAFAEPGGGARFEVRVPLGGEAG